MQNKHITRIVIVLVILLFFLAISIIGFQFTTRNALKNDLIGKQMPCKLPCWNNITPGVTKSNEAVKILNNTSYINKGSISQSGNDDFGGCIWEWKVSGGRLTPRLYWQNGVVQEISLSLAFKLTIKDILIKFGLPENVGIMQGGTPENWYWIIDMFYPQSGIQIKAYTSYLSTLIDPTTEIGAIDLYLPTSIEKRISNLYPEVNYNDISWLFTSWKGYGDINKLYLKGNNK